jgi:outer membrane usher protein
MAVAALAPAAGIPATVPQAAEAPAGPRLELLAVAINSGGQSEPIWVLRTGSGEVYLPAPLLASLRLIAGPARTILFDGVPYVAIGEVPGVVAQVDEAGQSLLLTVAPDSFEGVRTRIAEDGRGAMTPSGLGGFMNYDLLAQLSGGRSSASGAVELGVFSGWGTASTTFIGRLDGGAPRLFRLETNWTIDDPGRMRSLRFGDGISRGGLGSAPLRFGGVQIATNFATRPGFVATALPTVSGSAAVPSVVDIYVNNMLQARRSVEPGPFQLTDVPVVTGSGDIRLIVRDPLGRERVVVQSYYVAPQLVGDGLHDYSYELGFLRRDYGLASNAYGAPFVAGTHRYGLSDGLTVEAHVEAARRTQSAGIGVSLLLPGFGILSASAAAGRSDEGSGGLFTLGFERRGRGLSVGAAGEVSTRGYATLGSPAGQYGGSANARLFAGLPTGFGSIGGSVLWRRTPGRPDVGFLGGSASVRLAGLGTLNLSGRHGFAGPDDSAAQFYLTIPIGGRSSASSGVHLRDGVLGATGDVQRNLPEGPGFGYRASAALGAFDRLSGAMSVQTGSGNLDGEASWVEGRAGVRMSLSGAIATVGGAVFASRRIDQSFAAVRVGRYPGVRVYADNRLVGRTNRSGVLLMPRLRPFEDNRIRIEVEDLPLDATIAGDEQTVRPFNRSGVAVRFAVANARGGRMRIVLESGDPLPAGTAIRLNGEAQEFVSASGGDVYLTGLRPGNVAVATFGARSCRFRFAFASGAGPQPDLGQFECVTGTP